MNKINLKSYSLAELEKFMGKLGEPIYRAKQIFKWIYKGKHNLMK